MASNSTPLDGSKPLSFILGFACLVGLLVDLIVVGFPYSLTSSDWRFGILQQLSARSVVFLLAFVLLLYSFLDINILRKRFSQLCLVLGVLLLLSTLLVVIDAGTTKNQAMSLIGAQVSQVQAQLEAAKTSPNGAKVTPQQLEQATALAQERAITQVAKTTITTIGNLVVMGLAMLALGRYGLRTRRKAPVSMPLTPPDLSVESPSS